MMIIIITLMIITIITIITTIITTIIIIRLLRGHVGSNSYTAPDAVPDSCEDDLDLKSALADCKTQLAQALYEKEAWVRYVADVYARMSLDKEFADMRADTERRLADSGPNEVERLKAEFEPLALLMKGVLDGIVEEVLISSELRHSPCVLAPAGVETSGDLKSGLIMKVNPEHSIMTELKRKAESDQLCNMTDVIWLLFDISWLTSRCSNFEDFTHVAGGMHRVAKRELRIFRDGQGQEGRRETGATACPDVEQIPGAFGRYLAVDEHSDTAPLEGLGGEYNTAADEEEPVAIATRDASCAASRSSYTAVPTKKKICRDAVLVQSGSTFVVPRHGSSRIAGNGCLLCGESFLMKTTLKEHEIAVHGDKLKCAECRKSFKSSEDLRRHSRTTQHAIPLDFQCPADATGPSASVTADSRISLGADVHPNRAAGSSARLVRS